MLQWLVQTDVALPSVARGILLDRLFHPVERARFEAFNSVKRQQDWLMGRWTAKNLLAAVIVQQTGETRALNELVIVNDRDGVPFADGYPQYSLSISHIPGCGLCGLIERPNWPIGFDIERIAPRIPVFVDDYFTPSEIKTVNTAPVVLRDTLITAIWSAKEAVLKALHLGLSVDTRSISCWLDWGDVANAIWMPFSVQQDEVRTGRNIFLNGWWRIEPPYVLTCAIQPWDA
jgi:4'-phosphopantetheinyl transferase